MNIKVLILLFTVLVTGLLSCKKGTADLPPFVDPRVSVNVVNATADTINLYQNGTRINNTSSFYPNGSLGYIPIISGPKNYQIKKAGTTEALVNVPLTLDTATVYSMFIAGASADRIFLTRDSLIVDSLITAKTAVIRFVNASAGANLDVTIGSGFMYQNQAFKSATDFKLTASGSNTLTIYESGSATPLASGSVNLIEGNTYTLFTRGTIGATGNNAFGTRLIRNR